MAKTKEQSLNEQKIELETIQMPTRLSIEKLTILKSIIETSVPLAESFGEGQKWITVWSDNEIEVIKLKVLQIIRDL